jgi:hypothetical protein
MAYGGKVGVDVRLGDSPLSFSARFTGLSMDLPLREAEHNRETSKGSGPRGVLLGLIYPLR